MNSQSLSTAREYLRREHQVAWRCAEDSPEQVDSPVVPELFTRTLRLKVRPEADGWLNRAAIEVNQVFNWANEISMDAAARSFTEEPTTH